MVVLGVQASHRRAQPGSKRTSHQGSKQHNDHHQLEIVQTNRRIAIAKGFDHRNLVALSTHQATQQQIE